MDNLNTLPVDEAFIELTDLVKRGEIVVFAGSGLSSRYHPNDLAVYPAWWELVSDLCTKCSIKCEEITCATHALRLQELASLAKKANVAVYTEVIGSHFAKTITDRRESYNLLIAINFLAYVTTNYDPLLAQAAASYVNPKEVCAYPDIKCGDVDLHRVIYLHGYVGENTTPIPDKLILAKEDFESAYLWGLECDQGHDPEGGGTLHRQRQPGI